jgi:CMP/dCMP kinase
VIRSVVALGGPPGSGKSTAGRRVADELGLTYRSAGEVFREQARQRGLSLEAFGRYAEEHPEVDRELDRAMEAFARPGVILEGRVQGALCRRRGQPVLSLAVTASLEERARRVAHRDGGSVEQARSAIVLREASERQRYLAAYGIDLDREPVDLEVDSTRLPPAEVAHVLVEFLRTHGAGATT